MRLSVHHLVLPFRMTFQTAGWKVSKREALLLHITDPETGLSGYGEAAPLPLYGTETLNDTEAALQLFIHKFNNNSLNADTFAAECLRFVQRLRNTPSACFAIETAILDLLAREKGISLAQMLGGVTIPDSIPVNTVIGGGSVQETQLHAEKALKQGFTCLKLKIGATVPEIDINRVEAVRTLAGKDVAIRLDANRAWDFDTALFMLEQLARYDIEYIEEPVADIDRLAELCHYGFISIAVDESIQDEENIRRILVCAAADVLVIKPMTAGGLLRSIQIAEAARVRDMDVVFTSFLESAVGRNATAQLCAALPQYTRHHGLATGALFNADVATDNITNGRFILPQGEGLGFEPDLQGLHASS